MDFRQNAATSPNMNSLRAATNSLEGCVSWIRKKQEQIQNAPLGTNFISVQQSLEQHRRTRREIGEYRARLGKFSGSKYRQEDIDEMATGFNQLQDMTKDKGRCLDTLFHVSELEDYYQNLSAEIEKKALDLTEHEDHMCHGNMNADTNAAAKSSLACIYAVRNTWSWLNQISRCLETHLTNSAAYHQFFHEVRHCDHGLKSMTSWLNSEAGRKQRETADAPKLTQEIRDITQRLLDFQVKVESLFDSSGDIVPLKSRRDMSKQPRKVRALITYTHNEMQVTEDEECLLIDNSDSQRWKVRNTQGLEGYIPALAFLVPPPDHEALQGSHRVRMQMMASWSDAVNVLRPEVAKFLTKYLQSNNSSELKHIILPQRKEILAALEDALTFLKPRDSESLCREIQGFSTAGQSWKDGADQIKDVTIDPTARCDRLPQDWKSNQKLVRQLQELEEYVKAYTKHLDSTRGSHQCVVGDKEDPLKFVSSAYIQRVKPDDKASDENVNYEHIVMAERPPVSKESETPKDSKSTSKETKTFVIVGIVDPRTGKQTSIYQAIADGIICQTRGVYINPVTGQTMPIPEAMSKGLILVEYTNTDANLDGAEKGVITTTTTMETVTYSVTGVIDPTTRQRISVTEAIKKGILDKAKGLYLNPRTGKSISLTDAIDRGLVIVEVSKEDKKVDVTDGSTDESKYVTRPFSVLGVLDPETKHTLTLEEAVDKGIIVTDKGLYVNPTTGEIMSLTDALKKGYLRVRLANPKVDDHILYIRAVRSLHENGNLMNGEANGHDTSAAVFSKLKNKLDASVVGIKHPGTNLEISIQEALQNGYLRMDKLEFVDENCDTYSLTEACIRGYINNQTAKELLSACEGHSLQKLASANALDLESGTYIDPKTGKRLSLAEAIKLGKIDPDMVFYMDNDGKTVTSLSAAIASGKLNADTGKIRDPKTGEDISIVEAIKRGLINPEINSDKILEQIAALKCLRPLMDTLAKGIKNPSNGNAMTVEEAIMNGVLDLPHADYVNTSTSETLPIAKAAGEELIKPSVAKSLLAAMNKSSLGEHVRQSKIDPNSGSYINPKSKEKRSLDIAAQKGYIDPSAVYVVDKETNRIESLASLAKLGKFDLRTAKMRDPQTGRGLSLSDAAKKGLIHPYIDSDSFLDESCPVQHLLENGRVQGSKAVFVSPGGQQVALEEALAKGYLTPSTMVKFDPKTGYVTLSGDGKIIQALIETKKNCEWIEGVEAVLSQHDKPRVDEEGLKEQIALHKNLSQGMVTRREPVSKLLRHTQALLEAAKSSTDPGTQQQSQRLRSSASEMKARFQTVANQLDTRQQRLNIMNKELGAFNHTIGEFNDWLDGAQKNLADIKKSPVTSIESVESMAEDVKKMEGEIKAKEENLQTMKKSGVVYQSHDKEYKKEAEKFIATLQKKKDSIINDPEVNLDQQIEKADQSQKELLGQCSNMAATLTDTLSKRKDYDSLNAKLNEWYPKSESALEKLQNLPHVTNSSEIDTQLGKAKDLSNDVIKCGQTLDNLKKVGEELITNLTDMEGDSSTQVQEIQESIMDNEARYDRIRNSAEEKHQDLQSRAMETKDVQRGLTSLLEWARETETLFDEQKPVSLNQETLKQQVQANRVVTADILSHKASVESVGAQAQSVVGARAKIDEIQKRVGKLETRAKERGDELEVTLNKVDKLCDSINQLDNWLINAVKAIDPDGQEGETRPLRDKIEDLYKIKQSKQQELDDIKSFGKDLLDETGKCDKNRLREVLSNVQNKWHNLNELLVQMITMNSLRDIDDLLRYLDKAENEINTAEPISTDPETLAVQLRDHKSFHDDLENKKEAVSETIDRCNKMLRDTTTEEAQDIKSKLDTIRNQADLVCKLSSERLAQLEEALPLASHFSETHSDLQAWLGEIEAEIESLDFPAGNSAEQIKKQQDNAKTTQRIIDDHKPLVEDLINTAQELIDICSDEDASDIKEDIDSVNSKYEHVRAAVRNKLNLLDEAFRQSSSEITDSVDGLLEELHYLHDLVEYVEPVAANPDALREQILDNNNIVDDLERRKPAVASAKDAVKKLFDVPNPESQEDYDDLRSKVHDMDVLQANISRKTDERARKLDKAMLVAEKFHREYHDVIRALKDIQDNLISQDSPGVDVTTIKEQQKELKAIEDERENAKVPLQDCRKTASQLVGFCGTPGKMEVQKHMEDLDNVVEEIDDGIKDRDEELRNALDKAEQYDSTLQGIMNWLPKSEERIKVMQPVSTDARSIRIQIEELKVLKLQVHPRCVDVQSLNQYLRELKTASPVTGESLGPQVQEVNDRWNTLLKNIADRERQLNDSLVRLGEVDHAMDDIIGYLQQAETELSQMDDIYGDPKYIEMHLKKLQLLQNDMKNQEVTMKKLGRAVDDMMARSGKKTSPLSEKLEEMNESFHNVQVMAMDRQNQMHDALKQVKAFMGEVEDLLRWLTEFKQDLKTATPLGALPDSAQKQFDKFMVIFVGDNKTVSERKYREMGSKEEEVQLLLLNGEDMLARCGMNEARHLLDGLGKLKERMQETKQKADRKKKKLHEHLENVRDFHAILKVHTEWLSNAEKVLATFKYPSKLVDRVLKQIDDHAEFKQDVDAHWDIMQNLDRTGTYLKYFGRKQDTVYIKNLLISIKLRWKKLVRRADERGRLLQQAHKEDKRFHESWKGLLNWLEDGEQKLKKYAQVQPAGKMKQDIDELKMYIQAQEHFQHQLSAKHPTYYSTMRLGRSLKDRCTKNDAERDILQGMCDDLKNKWSVVRSIVSQRQNKLDEALLSSGRFSDALQSLLEWLTKAEGYLGEDQPTLGDIDTVNILIEQHKQFQQELASRQNMIVTMRTSPNIDQGTAQQLDELTHVWDRVNQLTDIRETKLQEAVKLADDFSEAVQVMREWLPTAESELKFRALPEDEGQIIELIENHEKLQEELQGQQSCIEKIKFLADEILQSCHPNAVRFVKYYLTITQTRWEQLLGRASQRSQRLQEALRNLRGNAALLEDIIGWLSEAHALLAAKEKDEIPEDLLVVDALSKEHLEFHEELAAKNKDVERLTKSPTKESRKAVFGSNWKLNETDSPSPRVTTLQTKWRNVWRMSVDRKKKLQDSLDHLLELESFKNFDFDLWKQRYMNWIRAKKFRITDFFRRQDKDNDGLLTRKEFVEGMLASKFPTNRTEMNAVFDIFDRSGTNTINNKEFVDALKSDRHRQQPRRGKRQLTEAEMVHDEIEQHISHCQCRHQFRAEKIADGKYRFGENQKLRLVRFLNSNVMVRVGGGWVTMSEFLDLNDPCRAKNKHHQHSGSYMLSPDSASPSTSMFMSSRRNSTPDIPSLLRPGTPTNAKLTKGRESVTPTPKATSTPRQKGRGTPSNSTNRRPDDLSSNSSVHRNPKLSGKASNLASSKRSHLAASWSNLSTASTPLSVHRGRREEFGSSGSLNVTPTPSRSNRKPTTPTTPTTPRTGSSLRKSTNTNASPSPTPRNTVRKVYAPVAKPNMRF